MKNIVLGAVAAAFVTTFSAGAASAEEFSVAVDYSDLNVASPAGAQALASRINSAIDTACAKPQVYNVKLLAEWQQCRAGARSSAAEQLNQTAAASVADTVVNG